MTEPKRLLILGGTGEAAELAERAVARFAGRLDVTYSLAGRIKPLRELAGQVRVGGFGGSPGLAAYLEEHNYNVLVDATHPFAATISSNAYDACLATDTPRLTLFRPPWELPPGAKYLEADDIADAARQLSRFAARILVTTGQSALDALSGYPDLHFVVRVIEAPDAPLADNITLITGRPPYSLDDEIALIDEHAIDALLTKQSGGNATVSKIAAALRRNIPIVAIRRPLPEPGESVDNVDAALNWLEEKL